MSRLHHTDLLPLAPDVMWLPAWYTQTHTSCDTVLDAVLLVLCPSPSSPPPLIHDYLSLATPHLDPRHQPFYR